MSLTVMWALKKSPSMSLIGISIAGGVGHNLGQLLMAMLTVETYGVFSYFPILMVSGLLTGLAIGIGAREMLLRLGRLQF